MNVILKMIAILANHGLAFTVKVAVAVLLIAPDIPVKVSM
jgi:hypothetical protein